MSENSKIEWTDHTFNPWWGCSKVSPGCDHCYAEALDKRTGGDHWGAGVPRRRTSPQYWNIPRRWNAEAERTGKRPRVFCASMADVFDNEVPKAWRTDLWQLIRETPQLRWLLLTKRIGNAEKMLPADWPGAFPHVGLMISVVNQQEADRDIPKLLDTPAAWRGLSMEPLLGLVDISVYLHDSTCLIFEGAGCSCYEPYETSLDWVIVGGESGHGARPMHPEWAQLLRDQCIAAEVPFFFKQWGDWLPIGQEVAEEFRPIIGKDAKKRFHIWQDKPGNISLSTGKKAAGRKLDFVEHNALPEALA